MRNRAFARYTEFTNVVDQIPKPFTPELLKSGVANALQTGALVVQSQRTGCAMPEAVGEDQEAAIEGHSKTFPIRTILDFLTNTQIDGRITFEQNKDRLRFALAAGRIQAVYSQTISADRLAARLPADLADLGPLLSITLGENQDASMSGLVKLLERSLSDPRRLRALLRFQSAVLTYWTLTGETGKFSFEPGGGLPPMFQAFPLQLSLPALAVEGARRCVTTSDLEGLASSHFVRHSTRGGNADRTGLGPAELRVHTLLDGVEPLSSVATRVGVPLAEVAAVALGFEISGQAERRTPASGASILLIEDDGETVRTVTRVLGAEGEGCQIRHVRDRVAAQLLVRRNPFSVVMLSVDNAEQETFYLSLRGHAPGGTRFVGVLRLEDEGQLERLDSLGLDGVLHRPVSEPDLRSMLRQLLGEALVAVS